MASSLVGLGTLPVTAWTFSQADVGRVSLFQVTVTFVMILATLGLDQSFVREYHEREDPALLFRDCILPPMVMMAAVSVLAVAFAGQLARALFGTESTSVIMLLVIGAWASLFARFFLLILRMDERGLAHSAGLVAPRVSFLVLLVAAAVVVDRPGFWLLAAALTGANVVGGLWVVVATRSVWRGSGSWRQRAENLPTQLRFGLPLM
ncbi:MAG TPA: oligosaccharide flippase family protein, partial [Nocardioidaceae bacterium]|nr:oligosaccharide flippase family protein [Nocardioidaceae bacterium]